MPTEQTAALKLKTNLDTGLLKLIAVLSMAVDHVGSVFFPKYPVFRWIGRLTFPIFAYCLTVGLLYTHDIKKYLVRPVERLPGGSQIPNRRRSRHQLDHLRDAVRHPHLSANPDRNQGPQMVLLWLLPRSSGGHRHRPLDFEGITKFPPWPSQGGNLSGHSFSISPWSITLMPRWARAAEAEAASSTRKIM